MDRPVQLPRAVLGAGSGFEQEFAALLRDVDGEAALPQPVIHVILQIPDLVIENRQIVGPRIAVGGAQTLESAGGVGYTVHMHSPGGELRREEGAVRGVVVDTQHTKTPQLGQVHTRGGRGRRPLGQSRGEPERAARSGDALDADRASHHLHESLGDREPQTRPSVPACRRAVGLRKGLEQPLAVLGRDADAGVGDRKANQGVVIGLLDEGAVHDDFATLGELHRVADEIREDLPQTSGVASHPRREVRVRQVRELQALSVGAFGEQLEHVLHRDAELEVGLLEVELAGLYLGEVQDVVDDRQEPFPGPAHRLGVLSLLSGQRGVQQEPGHPDDAVHGCADLVAHRGEKSALGATRLFGYSTRFAGGLRGPRHLRFGLLQFGDVRVHGDGADFRDLPLTDLEPTTVAELLHEGSTRLPVPRQALRDPRVDSVLGVGHQVALGDPADDLLEWRPHEAVRGVVRGELTVPAVAQDEPLLRIVQREGFRDALDSFEQARSAQALGLRRGFQTAIDDGDEDGEPDDEDRRHTDPGAQERRIQPGVNRLRPVSREHIRRRHARVVHTGHGAAHHERRSKLDPPVAVDTAMPAAGEKLRVECRGREHDRHDDGYREEHGIISHHGVHAHRGHAGVVHDADAGTHERAADDQFSGRDPRLADDVKHDPTGKDGRGHRHQGDPDVIVDPDWESKRQHADEVHRPDADAHGHRPGREPRSLGERPVGSTCPLCETENGIGRQRGDDDRERDEHRIVGRGQREP